MARISGWIVLKQTFFFYAFHFDIITKVVINLAQSKILTFSSSVLLHWIDLQLSRGESTDPKGFLLTTIKRVLPASCTQPFTVTPSGLAYDPKRMMQTSALTSLDCRFLRVSLFLRSAKSTYFKIPPYGLRSFEHMQTILPMPS